MEEKIIELIEAIKNSSQTNNITILCTIVSSFVAIISLITSLYLFAIEFKDRHLRKKVLGYVYSYYAPSYTEASLPTTKQVQCELKNLLFSEKDIFETLIILNKEGLIEAVADFDSTKETLKWKPNTIYAKRR